GHEGRGPVLRQHRVAGAQIANGPETLGGRNRGRHAERFARPAPPVQQRVARRRFMELPLMRQGVVDDDPLPVLLNLDRTVHRRAPDSRVTFVPSSISIRSFSNLSALSTSHTCSWSARRLSY